MVDETKPIAATDIVNDPQVIYTLNQQYIMLKDTSPMATYKNMIEAINIFGDLGWELVSTMLENTVMYAMIRNTNYKQKNQ
ncbi:MAG: hypothetical protein WBC91_01460 [Phototrophicaceae bacterium]